MYLEAQQPLMLSSPTLDADLPFSDEKEPLSPPAYELQAVKRKRKHMLLVGSLIVNAILTLSLGALWGPYYNKFSWKGVQPIFSEHCPRCHDEPHVLIGCYVQPPSTK